MTQHYFQDTDPEVEEQFGVELTGVRLVDEEVGEGAVPSIVIPMSNTVVTITENDNARGLVQFDMSRVSSIGEHVSMMNGLECF